MSMLGWSPSELARACNISESLTERRRRRDPGGSFSIAESERIYKLASIALAVEDVLGVPEKTSCWLTSPNQKLGWERPFELLGTDGGMEKVLHLLKEMRS
jgi:putative toxin-antitoxin system antitoxin component (TIGR02293 family)